MEIHVQFLFRAMEYSCTAIIDSSQYPCYIFTTLESPALYSEFGNDVTIATNGKKRLDRQDDFAALVELRQAMFNAIEKVPEFLAVKVKMNILSQEAIKEEHSGNWKYPRLVQLQN